MSELEPNDRADMLDGQTVREFVPNAMRTCSTSFYGSRVPQATFTNALQNVAASAQLLDALKKGMFYGRDIPSDVYAALGTSNLTHVIAFSDNMPEDMRDIMHGIIGIITEAGEMAELLLSALETGTLDNVNLKEEMGDVLWYFAPIMHRLQTNFPAEMARVIRKLKTRFPDKYTDDDANQRDLFAERATLESESDIVGKGEIAMPTPPNIGSAN